MLTQMCPWDEPSTDSHDPIGVVASEAITAGFRTICKRRWDKLRDEYLEHQKDLLTLTLDSEQVEHNAKREAASHPNGFNRIRHMPSRIRPIALPPPPPPPGVLPPNKSYPENCLVFVKNIHPDTNKTTLKALFKQAFNGERDSAVDYVDYTKGMDSVRLHIHPPCTHGADLVEFASVTYV